MHDLADIIVKACSHFCGQARCFTVDGQAMPVCERCLGLYLGALVTLAWLIAAGIWRRPAQQMGHRRPRGGLAGGGAGGLHAIDTGPRWRLACGLLTGHVTAFWLAAGVACLWSGARRAAVSRGASPRSAQIQGLAMPILLGIFPAFFWPPAFLNWWLWTTMACLGIAALWGLSLAAIAPAGVPIAYARRPSLAAASGCCPYGQAGQEWPPPIAERMR